MVSSTANDASRQAWQGAWLDGTLASLVSGLAVAWRSRADTGSPWAGLNAPSHWWFGDDALRRNAPSWRYTATGSVVHAGSSMLWGALYAALRRRHAGRPGGGRLGAALGDAAAVSALVALVDLKLTPRRFTPGFERRLRPASLATVYAGFALGLLMADRLVRRGR